MPEITHGVESSDFNVNKTGASADSLVFWMAMFSCLLIIAGKLRLAQALRLLYLVFGFVFTRLEWVFSILGADNSGVSA